MNEYLIRLAPLAPLSGCGATVPAAALFNALCRGIETLLGAEELQSILEKFKMEPPFLLSSAFPWKASTGGITYYLPQPLLPPLSPKALKESADGEELTPEPYHTGKLNILTVASAYKRFRRLNWVPEDSFKQVLKSGAEGELFGAYLRGHLDEMFFAGMDKRQRDRCDLHGPAISGIGEAASVPHYAEGENHGLYFLLKTDNLAGYLRPALAAVHDLCTGAQTGKKKSSFRVEVDPLPLFGETTGGAFITLSPYLPGEALDMSASTYRLAPLRSPMEPSWLRPGSNSGKAPVFCFTPGSALKPKQNKSFYGSLAPLEGSKGKRGFLYGYAYPVWFSPLPG